MMNPIPGPVPDATATRRGLMGVVAQTLAGIKTFLDPIRLAFRTTTSLPVGGVELEGQALYDSTIKRPRVHNGTSWLPVALVTGSGGTSLEDHVASTAAHPSSSVVITGPMPPWADTSVMITPNVQAALETIIINLSNREQGEAGSDRLGVSPVTQESWAGGGELNGGAGGTLTQMLNALVGELADSAGASKLGAVPSGSLSSNTVQGQLNELRDEKASLSGAVFTGAVAAAGYSGGPVAATTGAFSEALSANDLQFVPPRGAWTYLSAPAMRPESSGTVWPYYVTFDDSFWGSRPTVPMRLSMQLNIPLGATINTVEVECRNVSGSARIVKVSVVIWGVRDETYGAVSIANETPIPLSSGSPDVFQEATIIGTTAQKTVPDEGYVHMVVELPATPGESDVRVSAVRVYYTQSKLRNT